VVTQTGEGIFMTTEESSSRRVGHNEAAGYAQDGHRRNHMVPRDDSGRESPDARLIVPQVRADRLERNLLLIPLDRRILRVVLCCKGAYAAQTKP
jgi:hypothetical protein